MNSLFSIEIQLSQNCVNSKWLSIPKRFIFSNIIIYTPKPDYFYFLKASFVISVS